MAVTFQLRGVPELIKKLRKLRGIEMRRVIRQAVREAAKPVRDVARQIVPIGEGRLVKTIKVRSARRSKKLIAAIIVPGRRQDLGIEPDAKGFYPTHIELGFKSFPGNRFLRDAMELQNRNSIQVIQTRIAAGIKRAVA